MVGGVEKGAKSLHNLVVENATKFYNTKSGPLHALYNYSMMVGDGE